MKHLALAVAAVALTACAPPIPDSGAPSGVGFQNYSDYRTYRSDREGALEGQQTVLPPAPVITSNPLPPESPARTTVGVGTAPAETASTAPVQTASAIPETDSNRLAPVPTGNNPGISDEQDFKAVSSRETIESDKERLAANRAQYVQIEPGALPQRTGAAVSPIIDYALKAPNRLGQSIYSRSGIALTNSDKACAKYASPAAAQEAFLKAGGPKRDPKNLDPDGDGFACSWDPTPFQKVRG
jgi:hypothetical protein